MFDWIEKLQDAPKVALVGAVLGSGVTLFVAFLTILLKDFYIPILAEKRALAKIKNGLFRKYAHPIMTASISLLFRLDEILNKRGRYLLLDSPKTPFYTYKYISTIYRLCALMGWMRASTIEFSNVEVKNGKDFRKLQSAITAFEISLADGQHVEEKVLAKLCELTQIDISQLTKHEKNILGARLEDWIEDFCHSNSATSAFSLDFEKRLPMVKHVADKLCSYVSIPAKHDDFFTDDFVDDCVKNMVWREGLIYRDWQAAIGDLMLTVSTGTTRRYEVLGYKEFEEIYLNAAHPATRWLERSEKLFKDLDISNPPIFDVRPEQLVRLFISTYDLLKVNSELTNSNVKIAENMLARFSSIYQALLTQKQNQLEIN